MSTVLDKETSIQSKKPDIFAPAEATASQSPSVFQPGAGALAQQSLLGNGAIARADSSAITSTVTDSLQLQSTFGNAAVTRSVPPSEVGTQPAAQVIAPLPAPATKQAEARVEPVVAAVPATKTETLYSSQAPSRPQPEAKGAEAAAPVSTADVATAPAAASPAQPDAAATTVTAAVAPPAVATPAETVAPTTVAAAAPAPIVAAPKTAPTAATETAATTKSAAPAGATTTAAATQTAAPAEPKAKKVEPTAHATATAAAPGGGEAEAAPPSPREAIAPAASAIRHRASAARSKHSKPDVAVDSAQNAHIEPDREQSRVAAKQTVENMNATGTEPVKRDDFRTKLRQAIDAVMAPPPKTKDAADRMMESGASQANSAMRGHLATERDEAAKPFESAAHNEVPPNKVQPEMQQTKLEIESVGAPPAPVSAAPVVPAPLPAERLDYSSDREPTDQAMAENGVTKEQLEKGNEPAFESTLKERSAVEKHEAKLEAQYRQSEAKVQGNAHDAARKEIAKGLGGIHGARALHIGNVAGQQVGTRDKSELEHKRITDKINEIKRNTKDAVEFILKAMDTNAMFLFNMGLKAAEAAYENTFKEEKGGKWTWLTTWGSSWERLIERSLAKARAEYFRQVEQAIDIVADYVDDQLRTAKLRVTSGFNEVKVFVNSLDKNFKQFGKEALDKVKTDFDDMGSEIDQHSDQLVDNLAQTYKASYQRMSTMEEKLREENKSLWQRIYDATVGLIKKIIAFKDMLMNVLAKAADVIGDIISDPIGFLGNLVDGVKLGIQNFSDHIEEHLKQGLIEWLFGELAAGGIQMPKTFDLKGILGLVMQILGLTYANIRARAVGIVGEKVVSALEQAAEIFKILITEGPGGLWKYIVEKIGDFKETILEQIKSFIIERIIVAGITWLIGLLNPASAFFKACKAIYDIIMFFVDHASQIAAFLNAIIDSIGAIAKGAIDVAAKFVESALAKAIPLIIGFLASLLGLGGISEKIKEIIAKIREPINAAIDWVIKKAVDMVKGIGKMLGFGKEEKKEEELPKDHSAMAEKAVAELEKPREEGEDYATLRKEKEAQAKDIELTYTAKLEPGIRLRVVFSEAGKGAEQDELDFDVIIAPNQVDRKGKVKASAEYKAPEVGSYKEMAKLGESEPKMKGGKMREAHHAPPVELAESLAAALTTAGNEMRSDPKTRDASEGVLDAAANLKGAAQQHGNDLPSILVHQDTHRTHGGSTARIHGSEIRAQLKKALEAEGVLDYAPTTSTGEVAVKPGGAAFQRQLETIALVQTGTSATTKKAMRAALKSHGPDIVIAAYNAEARRSLQAVKIAVMKSEVDGPKAKRAAALTELENRAYADWDALLAPIFSD